MIIVSDTSPILNLAVIGQLHLLPKLYGTVVVPQAVYTDRLGVNSIGLLGILIKANHEGLISSVGLIMDELRAKAGFWIGDDLYYRVLQAAGER